MDVSNAWETIVGMVNGFFAALPSLFLAIVVFVIFYFAAKWVRSLVKRLAEEAGLTVNAGRVLARLARWLMIIIGLLVALPIVFPSITAESLIGLLGISGIAIGFAFRDIFQNFLAGLLLLLTEPFQIGDQIVVGDYEGTVEDVQTRATKLKTYDGRRVVIPNADLFTDSVTVNTAFPKRRSQYDVGISYEDDIERARELMLEAIKSVEGVLDAPAPDVRVVELAGSSVNLRARWWTDSQRSSVTAVADRVITAVKYELDQNDVDIPFPIRTVLFHDQNEATNGHQAQPGE